MTVIAFRRPLHPEYIQGFQAWVFFLKWVFSSLSPSSPPPPRSPGLLGSAIWSLLSKGKEPFSATAAHQSALPSSPEAAGSAPPPPASFYSAASPINELSLFNPCIKTKALLGFLEHGRIFAGAESDTGARVKDTRVFTVPDSLPGTYLEDHPLHLTRYSARPCKRRIKDVRIRRDLWKASPQPPFGCSPVSTLELQNWLVAHLPHSLLFDAFHREDMLPHRRQLHFCRIVLGGEGGTRSGGGEPGLCVLQTDDSSSPLTSPFQTTELQPFAAAQLMQILLGTSEEAGTSLPVKEGRG